MKELYCLKEQKELSKDEQFFKDLNLNPLFDSIALIRDEFDIKKYFYMPLKNINEVKYRQDIFKDLLVDDKYLDISGFSYEIVKFNASYNEKYKKCPGYSKFATTFEMIEEYIGILNKYQTRFAEMTFNSEGLNSLKEYITEYLNADTTQAMILDRTKLKQSAKNIKFDMLLDRGDIKITTYEEVPDIMPSVLSVVKNIEENHNYLSEIPLKYISSQTQAKIYDTLDKFYPKEFEALRNFGEKYAKFIDESLLKYVSDIQFYIAVLSYFVRMQSMGLNFCIPEISVDKNKIFCNGGYDLALANQFYCLDKKIVPNDFLLENKERIVVVSGPNQGGKTTYARYIGQMYYFTSLGLPVCGNSACIPLVDKICTVFDTEEQSQNQNGKLQTELIQLHECFDKVTSSSLIILNEIFSSTSYKDGVFLGKKVIDKINSLDNTAVIVTFLDGLSTYNDTTISMESEVLEDNPDVRTLKILRKKTNGMSYAKALAKKNNVTYEDVKRRLSCK